jgi:DHA2 family multidrug resistance protein
MDDAIQKTIVRVNPWIISLSVVSATFMEVLDTTVVNVSLPHIAGSMSATVEEATWTLTSYLVANAIILPLTGWLARYFGRKRLLTLAVVGFTTASFLCALAPSLTVLIIFRVIQGASGGTMQPLSQAIMLESFAPEDRGKAMAFWGLCIVAAPIIGPVIGGWLTDTYSWRWVFYINIPVGILAFTLIRIFVFDPPYLRRPSTRIDYWGIGMLALGMACLQIFLDKGEQEDWFTSDTITTLAIIAAIALVSFVIYELTVPHPVVNLRVFKLCTFSTGVFLITVLGFVLYGSLVLLPIMLQTVLGYPSLQAGIAMVPRGLASFIFLPIVGVMLARIGPRKMLAFGFGATGITLLWLGSLNLNLGYWDIFWPQFIQGIAMACLFVPLTTITMDPIPQEEMGNATSIFNVMRNIGGSVGIAASATILARHRQVYDNILGAHINPYSLGSQQMLAQLRAALMARGSDLATATRRSYALAAYMVERQSSMLAFIDVFRLLGIIFILIIPLIWLMKRPRLRKGNAAPAGH